MAVKAFIRPPRYEYNEFDLGFNHSEIKGVKVER